MINLMHGLLTIVRTTHITGFYYIETNSRNPDPEPMRRLASNYMVACKMKDTTTQHIERGVVEHRAQNAWAMGVNTASTWTTCSFGVIHPEKKLYT